jgi:cell division protein ZapE
MNKILEPFAQYQSDLASGKIKPDASQEQAIQLLQRIYQDLSCKYDPEKRPSHGFFKSLFSRASSSSQPILGAYLWGGVGRGKTYLMGLFFNALNFKEKKRSHFNRFMEEIHAKLRTCQGEKDPLKHVAKMISQEVKVLCFDEFFVEDIADAMILGKLFEYLFSEGLCLVATSNRPPEDLYKEGLKREQFLPAIGWLKKNTEVLCVDSGIDYREFSFDQKQHYLWPLISQEIFLTKHFERIKGAGPDLPLELNICDRKVKAVRHCAAGVWIDFPILCQSPRGKADYIELANRYRTVLISNVPMMGESMDDQARRFIALIDELYDNHIEIVIAAMASPEALYIGDLHRFAFKRTISRLKSL